MCSTLDGWMVPRDSVLRDRRQSNQAGTYHMCAGLEWCVRTHPAFKNDSCYKIETHCADKWFLQISNKLRLNNTLGEGLMIHCSANGINFTSFNTTDHIVKDDMLQRFNHTNSYDATNNIIQKRFKRQNVQWPGNQNSMSSRNWQCYLELRIVKP